MKMRPAPVGLGITVASPIFAQDTVDPKTAQEIRALTMKYDEAFNRNDAAVVAALFSEDGFYRANGRFSGRHAIERFQGDLVFWVLARQNRVTTVDGVASVPSEVRSSGRCSETVRGNGSSLKDVGGSYSWVLVREGDSWKSRKAAYTE